MANRGRNRTNQPPSGQGKKQSPRLGETNKLSKRAEVLQASYGEQNIGSAEEEEAARPKAPAQTMNPRRAKAGR
jgi:hypothetical protein